MSQGAECGKLNSAPPPYKDTNIESQEPVNISLHVKTTFVDLMKVKNREAERLS